MLLGLWKFLKSNSTEDGKWIDFHSHSLNSTPPPLPLPLPLPSVVSPLTPNHLLLLQHRSYFVLFEIWSDGGFEIWFQVVFSLRGRRRKGGGGLGGGFHEQIWNAKSTAFVQVFALCHRQRGKHLTSCKYSEPEAPLPPGRPAPSQRVALTLSGDSAEAN